MTRLLEKAIAVLSQLPDEEQDALAVAILAEVSTADAEWDTRFEHSQESLDRLATAALEAHRRGLSKRLDPDEL